MVPEARRKSLAIAHFGAMKSPMVHSFARNEIFACEPLRAKSSLHAFSPRPYAQAAP